MLSWVCKIRKEIKIRTIKALIITQGGRSWDTSIRQEEVSNNCRAFACCLRAEHHGSPGLRTHSCRTARGRRLSGPTPRRSSLSWVCIGFLCLWKEERPQRTTDVRKTLFPSPRLRPFPRIALGVQIFTLDLDAHLESREALSAS